MSINGAPINSHSVNSRKKRENLIIDLNWLIKLGIRRKIIDLFGRCVELNLVPRTLKLRVTGVYLLRLLKRILKVEVYE